MNPLKVGDTVLWRGGWGRNGPLRVKVISLERCEPGAKHGDDVTEMPWADVPSWGVADLDNGHWAYGYQLSPLEES
jgi:hypothetical protein